jgi:dihydroorotate dehydrogenase (fumarate)/dihydroorotate dehydrogenase
MNLYQSILRPLLFTIDPERAHNQALRRLQWAGDRPAVLSWMDRMFSFEDDRLAQDYFGLHFPNPIGLAAGFDKNGVGIEAMQHLGFGALEIGSVSNGASAGNPIRPRLFRIPKDKGTIVFYGVPNDGAEKIANRIRDNRLRIPLGINLVETNTGKAWTAAETIEDMVRAAQPFLGIADYFALNLNCPNTAGGEGPFEDRAQLIDLLQGYRDYPDMAPTFLKVTATSEERMIDHYLEAAADFDFVKGIIFNLPPGNPYQLKTDKRKLAKMKGAVSGLPTQARMDHAIQTWRRRMDKKRWIIIGSGGIFTAEDAYRKIKLGASLLQLYTAMIYEGPGVVKQIKQGLVRLMEQDGVRHISEVAGTENK